MGLGLANPTLTLALTLQGRLLLLAHERKRVPLAQHDLERVEHGALRCAQVTLRDRCEEARDGRGGRDDLVRVRARVRARARATSRVWG